MSRHREPPDFGRDRLWLAPAREGPPVTEQWPSQCCGRVRLKQIQTQLVPASVPKLLAGDVYKDKGGSVSLPCLGADLPCGFTPRSGGMLTGSIHSAWEEAGLKRTLREQSACAVGWVDQDGVRERNGRCL